MIYIKPLKQNHVILYKFVKKIQEQFKLIYRTYACYVMNLQLQFCILQIKKIYMVKLKNMYVSELIRTVGLMMAEIGCANQALPSDIHLPLLNHFSTNSRSLDLIVKSVILVTILDLSDPN